MKVKKENLNGVCELLEDLSKKLTFCYAMSGLGQHRNFIEPENKNFLIKILHKFECEIEESSQLTDDDGYAYYLSINDKAKNILSKIIEALKESFAALEIAKGNSQPLFLESGVDENILLEKANEFFKKNAEEKKTLSSTKCSA